MKRFLISSIIVATSLFANEVSVDQFKDLAIIKQSNLVLKKAKDIGDNWYYIEALNRGSKIGVYTDKNKVIIGRGFYSETGQEIKFDIDVKKFKDNALFTIGNGENEYFLFTDPECPYCKMLDEKLSSNAAKSSLKIHTYFYPLDFHLLAKSMSVAVLSQDKNKRAEYFSELMKKDTAEIIKEVDKHSSIFYKDLLTATQNPAYAKMIKKYSDGINQVYGTSLNDMNDIKEYCEKKIATSAKSVKAENELNDSLRLTSTDFDVTGTPMLFDANGNKVDNPYMVFAKHGIVDIAAIQEIEKIGMTIQMGDKKNEKLYIFSSTKCPHCIKSFQDKELMKKLEKYNVHFILMDTGSNPQLAQKEMVYLMGLQDNKTKFDEFKRIMNGGTVETSKLDKQLSPSMENKMKLYSKHLMNSMVQSTPVIVDETGKIIENIK